MDWDKHKIRLFMSHLNSQRAFVQRVADILFQYGVQGFVAHADIQGSEPWRQEIVASIASSDAAVLFLHDGFYDSDFCDQETGIAYARGKKLIPLRFEHDLLPRGWANDFQAHDCRRMSEREVADEIFGALYRDAVFHRDMEANLLFELATVKRAEHADALAVLFSTQVTDWTRPLVSAIAEALEVNPVLSQAPHCRRWANYIIAKEEEARQLADEDALAKRRLTPPPLPEGLVEALQEYEADERFLEIVTDSETYELAQVTQFSEGPGTLSIRGPFDNGDSRAFVTLWLSDIRSIRGDHGEWLMERVDTLEEILVELRRTGIAKGPWRKEDVDWSGPER